MVRESQAAATYSMAPYQIMHASAFSGREGERDHLALAGLDLLYITLTFRPQQPQKTSVSTLSVAAHSATLRITLAHLLTCTGPHPEADSCGTLR